MPQDKRESNELEQDASPIPEKAAEPKGTSTAADTTDDDEK